MLRRPPHRLNVVAAVLSAAVILLVDQSTKLAVTDALTTRFENLSRLTARIQRMYAPLEYRGPDGRPFERNYSVKRSPILLGEHARVVYSESGGPLRSAMSSLFPTAPEELPAILWVAFTLGGWVLAVRLKAAAKLVHAGLMAATAGATSLALDFVSHGFTIEWMEVDHVGKGWSLRFNLAEAALCVGLLLLLGAGVLSALRGLRVSRERDRIGPRQPAL